MKKTKKNLSILYICMAMFFIIALLSVLDVNSAVIGVIIVLFVVYLINRERKFVKEQKKKRENQEPEREHVKVVDRESVYEIEGVRGRSIRIYKDKAVITVKVGFDSFLTGNLTDGEKTIYYKDVIGVQFKKSGLAIGYLQLETASVTMNNRHDNFFNENSFTFDTTKVSNEKMEEVANYVKKQVETYKNMGTIQVNSFSMADEIRKYKELLDMGAITQEEFDIKKKELLK